MHIGHVAHLYNARGWPTTTQTQWAWQPTALTVCAWPKRSRGRVQRCADSTTTQDRSQAALGGGISACGRNGEGLTDDGSRGGRWRCSLRSGRMVALAGVLNGGYGDGLHAEGKQSEATDCVRK
jgi:hypothetical protein